MKLRLKVEDIIRISLHVEYKERLKEIIRYEERNILSRS
jgi:hypothetical protein